MMITFSVPVYFTQHYTTKSDKTFLLGLNWYRNAHHEVSNNVKRHYNQLVKNKLKNVDINFNKKYRTSYTYHYKNKASDLMNVGAVIDKFVQDTLQEVSITKNDNVQFYTTATFDVGQQDKNNPRVEITIEELVDERNS